MKANMRSGWRRDGSVSGLVTGRSRVWNQVIAPIVPFAFGKALILGTKALGPERSLITPLSPLAAYTNKNTHALLRGFHTGPCVVA